MHVAVENQLALDDPKPIRPALQRLRQQGLSRHDAVHALMSVLGKFLYDTMANKTKPMDAHAYARELDQLTADAWRRSV